MTYPGSLPVVLRPEAEDKEGYNVHQGDYGKDDREESVAFKVEDGASGLKEKLSRPDR